MRQGRRNDKGLVRIGFLYTRNQPAGLSESGPFNKTGFLLPNPARGLRPKITNPEETQKSVTNPKSQIT